VIGVAHVIVLVALHGALGEVADEVGRHGYIILFLLIAAESFAFPLPGEVSLLVGAYEAQRGVFSLPWVIVVGVAAAITGDNLAYLVGRTAGRPVVERLLRRLRVPPGYLDRMDTYYRRHVGWTVVIARQVSPVRGLAAFSAGGSRVAWRRFFAFNAVACVVWATAVTLLAAAFVRHLDVLADDLSLAGLILLAVALAFGIVILWRRVRRRVERGMDGTAADVDPGEADASAADDDPGEADASAEDVDPGETDGSAECVDPQQADGSRQGDDGRGIG
jgi:membrane protein DedA with SNARE-associated domain